MCRVICEVLRVAAAIELWNERVRKVLASIGGEFSSLTVGRKKERNGARSPKAGSDGSPPVTLTVKCRVGEVE